MLESGRANLVLALDQLHEVVHDAVVKVLSTKMGVTGGGHDLEHSVVDGKDGHIEGASAQIEHQDVMLATCASKLRQLSPR